MMTKQEKKHARIFVIFNATIFISLQTDNIVTDSSAGLQCYSEFAYIFGWLILSLIIWKVIDRYDKKRIRNLNLSFLLLDIICAVGTFIPEKSVDSPMLLYLGLAIMIGIAIVLYKKYADKNTDFSTKLK